MITTYEELDELAREPLSPNFFMRDFLYSEIAAWNGLKNIPVNPELAISNGKILCSTLLEPLQATFGRIHIRSAYRSPEVNKIGNDNKLNCASNEKNRAVHIWDIADDKGNGATACILIPWLVAHIENGGSWTDMAWWIHDHLPYHRLEFFKSSAFNIGWHDVPDRRIDSYTQPRGCLTKAGMPNHAGLYADQYRDFPKLVIP